MASTVDVDLTTELPFVEDNLNVNASGVNGIPFNEDNLNVNTSGVNEIPFIEDNLNVNASGVNEIPFAEDNQKVNAIHSVKSNHGEIKLSSVEDSSSVSESLQNLYTRRLKCPLNVIAVVAYFKLVYSLFCFTHCWLFKYKFYKKQISGGIMLIAGQGRYFNYC